MMDERQQQLMSVRNDVQRFLNTVLDNIKDFPKLHDETVKFIPHIQSHLIPAVTAKTRSTAAVQNGLEGLGRWLEILRDNLISASPTKPHLVYYWVGKCIAVLADILLLIDIAVEKTKEGE
jgi:thiamine phosphate synthase YjbQ (UPF0047 family)